MFCVTGLSYIHHYWFLYFNYFMYWLQINNIDFAIVTGVFSYLSARGPSHPPDGVGPKWGGGGSFPHIGVVAHFIQTLFGPLRLSSLYPALPASHMESCGFLWRHLPRFLLFGPLLDVTFHAVARLDVRVVPRDWQGESYSGAHRSGSSFHGWCCYL